MSYSTLLYTDFTRPLSDLAHAGLRFIDDSVDFDKPLSEAFDALAKDAHNASRMAQYQTVNKTGSSREKASTPLYPNYRPQLSFLVNAYNDYLDSNGHGEFVKREDIEAILELFKQEGIGFMLRRNYRGTPNSLVLPLCVKQAQAVFSSHGLDNELTRQELEIHQFFQQWGSTSLGFGGIGGAAITTAITTIVKHESGAACVFYSDRFAYLLNSTNTLFDDHVAAKSINSVNKRHAYNTP